MGALRIAVVDDDWFKREHMKEVLDRSTRIEVVHSLDQHEAMKWTDDDWGDLDFAIVDVYDDISPQSVGTDMFSGIPALERLRTLDVRTLAITPHRHHPLVEHRVFQSGADYVYRRWDINDPDRLEKALLEPDESKRPQPVDGRVLRRYGADVARTNRAVAVYGRSSLAGKLYEGATHSSVRVSRRTLDGFVAAVRSTNFNAPPPKRHPRVRDPARWAHVRDYLLQLMGRKDAPPSNTDEQDDLWVG